MDPPAASESLALWLLPRWQVTAKSVFASLVVAGVITLSLALSRSLLHTTRASSLKFEFGSLRFEFPSSGVIEVLSLIFFLTLASASTSILMRINAGLVRSFLHTRTRHVVRGGWRYLVLERNLLNSWTNHLSLGIQALAFGAILIVLAGWQEALGLAIAAMILAVASRSFWHTSRRVSRAFIAHRASDEKMTDESPEADQRTDRTQDMVESLYLRDTEALRPSLVVVGCVSAGMLAAALVPIFLTNSVSASVLPIVVVILWRQRAMEFLSGTGHLAWLFTQYQGVVESPELQRSLDED